MGNSSSSNSNDISREGDIKQYKQSYQRMEETITANNVIINSLRQENLQLKKMLCEEEKENQETVGEKSGGNADCELQGIVSLYKELQEFKDKIEETKKNFNYNNHQEIEKLKQDNVELYKKLKDVCPTGKITVEKSDELKELEMRLHLQNDVIEQEVNFKLEEIKSKMNDASVNFAKIMENAVIEISSVLTESKEKMKLIERTLLVRNDPIYEKIKNVLLVQKNSFMQKMMDLNVQQGSSQLSSPTILNNLAGNVNVEKAKNYDKDINATLEKAMRNEIAQFGETKENKIIIFYAPESEDHKLVAQSILKGLTQLSLDNIEVYRLGKLGDKPRPMVVVFENSKQVSEVLQNRFSLADTKFKGIKIVKYKKEEEHKPRNKSNSSCGDEDSSDLEDEPYKIVLFFVSEDGNDYDKAISILRYLTKQQLKNIRVGRIGNKTDAKIRPMIISFDSQKYVDDALKNRYSLKDTLFKGIKVVKYKKPAKIVNVDNIQDVFPF